MTAVLVLVGLVVVVIGVAVAVHVARRRETAHAERQLEHRLERQKAWHDTLRRSGQVSPTAGRSVVFKDRQTKGE